MFFASRKTSLKPVIPDQDTFPPDSLSNFGDHHLGQNVLPPNPASMRESISFRFMPGGRGMGAQDGSHPLSVPIGDISPDSGVPSMGISNPPSAHEAQVSPSSLDLGKSLLISTTPFSGSQSVQELGHYEKTGQGELPFGPGRCCHSCPRRWPC